MENKKEKVADNLLKDINTVISEFEKEESLEKEALVLHKIFIRLAKLSRGTENAR